MLHLHLSNRPETLAAALAVLMRIDPLPLLERENVVTSSTALSRWLGLQLASNLGIATQIAYPFPAAFAWQLFGRIVPGIAMTNPFDRSGLQWRLMHLLGNSRAPEIKRFLSGDDGVKTYELATRLAGLFEHYLLERPDWIACWNNNGLTGLGPDESWQAGIWRALMAELPDVAPEHPRERFLAQLRLDPQMRTRLPRRISLFSVESMPGLYWEVFVALSEWIDLHVFVLSPSREYWGELDRMRARLRMEIEHPDAAALMDVGHPLLASLGRGRQHVVARLADATARIPCREHQYFSDPAETLLGSLQRDMLELVDPSPALADHSLQIHACHGPLREAEVLHGRLLALFEELPGLLPADILILTPAIETYAPAIESVLSHASAGRRIPCAVADRSKGQLSLWQALRRLLAVAEGELDAEGVMALLDEVCIRRAFDIEESELPGLRDWVAAAGIRCGLDAEERQRRGLPPEVANTWRFGLRRMLLGIAMPDEPERLWKSVLPMSGIEGMRAELLGRFIDYLEALFALAQKVGAGGTAPQLSTAQWIPLLTEVMERFFSPNEVEEGESQRIREVLLGIGASAATAACEVPLPLKIILREIDLQLIERAPAKAFSSGLATIASLQPGRPLGARVVCLVGMNDGDWPSRGDPLGFDLIARFPRQGDFNRRSEERYAFLEALLSASDALLITYTGRDVRSNVEYPPAAPLAELIDTLSAMTGLEADALVVSHPLQPFSRTCFDGSDVRRASYDEEYCPPVDLRQVTPFQRSGLPEQANDGTVLELDRLQRFLVHPIRFHLREQLGIHLEETEELLEIHEPFVADKLDAYRLREAFFQAHSQGEMPEIAMCRLRARGWLPHGASGNIACAAAMEEAYALWNAARSWVQGESLPSCEATFDDSATVLSGRLETLTADGLWRVRFGKTRPEDLLRLWLDHLLLQIAAPFGVKPQSVLIALDGETKLAPLTDPADSLADLLELYRQGLRAPLPFYPRTAWRWIERKSDWRNIWKGQPGRQIAGEQDDPYIRLALRDATDDPLGAAFQELAVRIFTPLRTAMTAGEGKGDDD